MSKLLMTKPLDTIMAEASEEGEHTLKRALGPFNLIMLGIGAIIGTGIFVLTGQAAATYAGPAIVLSFILAGLGSTFAGLCYAEFASLIPIAGSAYTYGYATLGEIFAWIIGWDLVLEYAFGAATVASGWSGYFVSLLRDFGIQLPPQWTAPPGTKMVLYQGRWSPLAAILPALKTAHINPATLPHVVADLNLLALLAVVVVTVVLIMGVRESANLNSGMVAIKLSVVFVFIGLAAMFVLKHPAVTAQNLHPFIPPNTGQFGSFGWSGIARGAAVIFFAYIGFDAVSTSAQEAKNPQKDMPIGIIGSLLICTVLYIVVAGLLTAIVPYKTLNVSDPVAVGVDAIGIHWGSILVDAGVVAGLASVMLVMLFGQSRVLYSMSRDGLLPKWASRIHPRFRTPWITSMAVGAFAAFFSSVLDISELAQLVNIGTLLAFVIVCAGVWVLRVRRPNLKRPFKTPLVPWIPILGALIAFGMMASLPLVTWIRLVVWLIIGMFIYVFYSRSHSKVRNAQQQPVPKSEP
jgi:APA family basic amino acid/polyamine antiporter